MLKTILLSSCVSVQGKFVQAFKDGRIAVRVGSRVFSGYPIG